MTYSVNNIKIDSELYFSSGPTAGYVLSINNDGSTDWISPQSGSSGASGSSGSSGVNGSSGSSGVNGSSGSSPSSSLVKRMVLSSDITMAATVTSTGLTFSYITGEIYDVNVEGIWSNNNVDREIHVLMNLNNGGNYSLNFNAGGNAIGATYLNNSIGGSSIGALGATNITAPLSLRAWGILTSTSTSGIAEIKVASSTAGSTLKIGTTLSVYKLA